MSKRKKRNASSNIPQTSMERVPQGVEPATEEIVEEAEDAAQQMTDAVEEVAEEVGIQAKPAPLTPLTPPVRRVRAVRRDIAATRSVNNRNAAPKKDPKTDTNYIRSRLANPTRFVTEDELRGEYGYVTKDLRAMGALAGVLVVVLFVLARVL